MPRARECFAGCSSATPERGGLGSRSSTVAGAGAVSDCDAPAAQQAVETDMRATAIERWCHPKLILVATNLLEGPRVMLEAVQQAKVSHAAILLVHVIRPAALRPSADPGQPRFVPSPALANAEADLELLAREFQYEGILCEPIILEGNPGEQIATLVRNRNVDRVIVAESEHHGIERLLFGCLVEGVAADLTIPVCIVGQHVCHRPIHPVQNVLVATSLRASSALCPTFGAGLVEANGGSLTLLHVLESGSGDATEDADAVRVAMAAMQKCLSPEDVNRTNPDYLVRQGVPAEEILKVAHTRRFDMVIMGAPVNSLVCRILGGSVIHEVVSRATCPVFTIKPTDVASGNQSDRVDRWDEAIPYAQTSSAA